MKFCADHWTKLRRAIEHRGLARLIPKSGEEAAERLVSESKDGASLRNYDPLMSAHNAIVGNALRMVGAALFEANDKDHCPICFLVDGCKAAGQGDAAPSFEAWIDRAADDSLEQATKLGFVTMVNPS